MNIIYHVPVLRKTLFGIMGEPLYPFTMGNQMNGYSSSNMLSFNPVEDMEPFIGHMDGWMNG